MRRHATDEWRRNRMQNQVDIFRVRMVGDDIAEDGIRYLQEINFKDEARRPASLN